MNADKNFAAAGWPDGAVGPACIRVHLRPSAAEISCLLMRPGVALGSGTACGAGWRTGGAGVGWHGGLRGAASGGIRCAFPPYAVKAEPALGRCWVGCCGNLCCQPWSAARAKASRLAVEAWAVFGV